ncbi:agmatinase [Kordiimonas aquimaris]|uniref:agmatinase n=1 Tax=Kordiimonas aquimaris TaxID=707591 RepID=UPI0021D12D2F|nr:agmatinase [Kordiimonas aquimaris]
MTSSKLDRLRAKYDGKGVFDNQSEKYKDIAQQIAGDEHDGSRPKPYSGISTFMDLPEQQSMDNLDVAVIGIPMDLAVSNRPGARLGPRAVRDIERIGPYNHQTDVIPSAMCRAADVGDVPFRSRFSLDQSMEDIEAYYKDIKAKGIIPLSVGGDHSVTYPILKALGAEEPVALIHIDAHCDTGGVFDGSKFHHGGPFRMAVLDGVLDPEKTIQIGIRGASEVIWEFSYESGMTVVHIEDFMKMGVPALIDKTRDLIGDMPVYVSIDVDGFDPAYAPGTGTPEVGGLLPREGIDFLRGLMGMNVIGADVVEVAPMYDPTSNTAQLGAQLLFEEFCLIAEAHKQRKA